MSKEGNALDRLASLMGSSSSLENDTITEDEYFADVAQRISSFEEVSLENEPVMEEQPKVVKVPVNQTIEEPIMTEEEPTPEIEINVADTGEDISEAMTEELFNTNTEIKKPKKHAGRRKKNSDVISTAPVKSEVKAEKVSVKIDSERNPLYDQLVRNLIDDLRKHKYTYGGFNNESMEILFQYIQNKF